MRNLNIMDSLCVENFKVKANMSVIITFTQVCFGMAKNKVKDV